MANNFRSVTLSNDYTVTAKIRIGNIKETYVYRGYPYADVLDEYGNLFTECSTLGIGGDNYNWSNNPLKKGMQVVLIPTGFNSKAIILGATFKPRNISDDGKGMILEDLETVQSDDHLKMSSEDYIVQVGEEGQKSYLQLTPKNGVILETDNIVRVQLPKDGILRISSDRQIVDEPLNGQQFINVITPFFQSLASITASQGDVLTNFNTALQTVSEGLDALAATSPGATVTNGQLAGYFATLATALAAAVTELAATNLQYGTLEYQYPTDELKPEMEATINRKVKLPK
jgi:hypothetical protein